MRRPRLQHRRHPRGHRDGRRKPRSSCPPARSPRPRERGAGAQHRRRHERHACRRETFPVLRRPATAAGARVTAPARAGCGSAPRAAPAAAGSTPAAATSPWPTCAAGSSSSTSGPSAASTACTSSTSCGRWRSSTPTRSSLIGVHSPKFEHEADADALAAAVERYAVAPPRARRPRAGRPGRPTPPAPGRPWSSSTPRATSSRPSRARATRTASPVLVDELVEEHAAKGTLRRGDAPYVAPPPPTRRCASRARPPRWPDGSFVVSDTAHHQLVHLEADLVTERARFGGSGHLQRAPGGARAAGRRGRAGRLRRRRRRHRQPPGQGHPPRRRRGPHPGRHGTASCASARAAARRCSQDLSTPWDVAWFIDRVVIAMAGMHQLWALHLAADPRDNTVAVLAGTSAEGLRDGAAHDAWFAQPSGLATSADGRRLWVADSETSALRSLTLDRRRASRSPPTSGRACSTSATGTVPPTRRCCSTRSASPSCPTARSRSATPTTAPSAASTPSPVRSPRWPRGCASPATRSSRSTAAQTRLVVVESAAHQLDPRAAARGGPAGRRPGPRDPAAAHPLAAGDVALRVASRRPRDRSSTTAGATPPG